MSVKLKLVKNKDSAKVIKQKLKKLQESDGFFAITIKREGFSQTSGIVRHSINDAEIIYWMEKQKINLLQDD